MKNFSATILAISIILLSAMPFMSNGAQGVVYVKSDGATSKQSNKIKNSSQAARIVKSKVGGKVLKVKNNGRAYKVKVIKDNGHIINVTVDAKSGRVK